VAIRKALSRINCTLLFIERPVSSQLSSRLYLPVANGNFDAKNQGLRRSQIKQLEDIGHHECDRLYTNFRACIAGLTEPTQQASILQPLATIPDGPLVAISQAEPH
jgi:hypothetical protein